MSSDRSTVFGLLLADALDLSWTQQQLADCGACVMVADSAADPAHSFDANARCCTYHPETPNFLLGWALRRGGDSERVVRARLAEPSGVSAWGIRASAAHAEHRERVGSSAFGHDLKLLCPYWVGGDLACGVWADRTGVCQTWFCRHDRGRRGATELAWLRVALTDIEHEVATLCVEAGEPPEDGAAVDDWVAWFTWCAERSEALSTEEIGALRRARLMDSSDELAQLRAAPEPQLPPILIPGVSGVWRVGDRFRIAGYSNHDVIDAPVNVFELLARLDGERPWRDALAEANAVPTTGGSADISEDLVYELFRIDAVSAPPPEGQPNESIRIGAVGAAWSDETIRKSMFSED